MTLHDCRDRVALLGPYLDGELGAAKLIELDEHVVGCETCREEVQLLRAMRGSLKRVVRNAVAPSLRDRIGNAMAAERTRGEEEADEGPRVSAASLPTWRTLVPLATAAAIALVWGAATRGNQTTVTASVVGDDLLAELLSEQSEPLPAEAVNAQGVRAFERYVGVPVSPGNFERAGAHLVGGRILSFPMRAQRAAMIRYVVGSGPDEHHVSVLIYDAQKLPEVGRANLSPRAIGTAEVRVGTQRGYSVAATQRAGVGYLLASDMDPDKNAELAAMVYADR
ncbi:MAG TPA: zf-HC2 domain-containing protein [Polyangiaceae bacterium]|jgi:anti-sigma factor RsiW|nr:zf-HC2 domain-containing protein [Polyangiaceae bacterium]